jgi:hypothetical protein
MLCTPLLATSLAACASTTSTSSFKGEQQKVAKAVSSLQSNATALEAKKVCDENLASANVARLDKAPGGCTKALETQLKEIDSFETTVESVTISGDTASAHVKGVYAGKKAVYRVSLRKEGDKWKVSAIS